MAHRRYKVEYAASALENLRSLPKREADQILRKVLRLEHGLHGNIKRLQKADAAFRLRVGDYRILFMWLVIESWYKKSATEKTFMISAPPQKPVLKRQQKAVLKQIGSLRELVEDLNDYLDLIEARARNKGKPTFTTDEVRKQLGLAWFFNQRSGTVIGMALTSQPQRAGFPLTLKLDAANLPKKSWVKISQIRTMSVERLSRKIGRAKPEEVELAITGLNQIVAP
jgi:mRNA-degrading endonuclease RelE of RelBE toxin-antitoxin system/mRNA-degrading endonuclease toxin of MazEF toxin-antitoxin module